MAKSPLPNVRSKNIEKERRRVLKALAQQLDAAERREEQGDATALNQIELADRKMYIAVRRVIKDSVDGIHSLNLSDQEKLDEIQKTLDAWKQQIGADDTINLSVRTMLFEYCDAQYRDASKQYAGGTDTHTDGQFDPEKFKAKVKTTIYDKIAKKIQSLPGMGTIDTFLQFAGQETLSSKINQKLGNVFNQGQSFSADDAHAKAQNQANVFSASSQQYRDIEEVADVRNRVTAQQSISSTTSPTRNTIGNDEGDIDGASSSRPTRNTGGYREAVIGASVESTKAIDLLTDIRDILAKQFKFDEDKKKEDDQEQADAELAAETASETTGTEPVRVENAENDKTATAPEAASGKRGIASQLAGGATKTAATRVGGALLRRIAPTAALSIIPGVASAGGTAAAGAMAGGASAAAGGGMFAALSAGLSGIVAAIGPILLALAAVAAAVYLIYKIFKNIDFTPILEPLAKGFSLLKDVVMTIWPLLKSVGKLLFQMMIVPLRVLGFAIGKIISVFLKLGPVVTPLIDGFTWLWQKAIKPMFEKFTTFFTFLSDVLEHPMDFLFGRGKFAKKETPSNQQQPQSPGQTPTGGRGGGPGPRAAVPAATGRGGGPGPIGAPNSASGVLSSLSAQMKGGYGGQATSGGATHAGVAALAQQIPSAVPGFNRFTGFNDLHHQESSPRSLHTKGLAMDFTVHGGKSTSPQAVAAVQNIANQYGVKVKIIDEYNKPSAGATGGHIHVEFPNEEEAMKMASALGVTPDEAGVPLPSVPGLTPTGPAGAAPMGQVASATPATPAAVTSGVSGARAAAPIARGTAAVNAAQTMAPAVTMVNALAPAVAAPAAPPTPMMIPIPVKARTENLFAYQTINAV